MPKPHKQTRVTFRYLSRVYIPPQTEKGSGSDSVERQRMVWYYKRNQLPQPIQAPIYPSQRPRHRSPSNRRHNKLPSSQYLARKAERSKINRESYFDVGCQADPEEHPCGVPQKGEQVSRTYSPMFGIFPAEVLVRKRGSRVIYQHPNW